MTVPSTFVLWLRIWRDTATHVSDVCSWTWTCHRSTSDCAITVNAFFHRCIACAGMFLLALACVSIPRERRRDAQRGEPVNAPLAQTSPAPSRPPSVWHTCFPVWRSAHPPLPSVSSLIPHLAHFQHAGSLFSPLSLSFPPVYLTHTPPPSFSPLSLWLSLLHLSHFQAVLSFTLFLLLVLLSHVCLTWFDI